VARVVENLPSKQKMLSSNPSTAKTNKEVCSPDLLLLTLKCAPVHMTIFLSALLCLDATRQWQHTKTSLLYILPSISYSHLVTQITLSHKIKAKYLYVTDIYSQYIGSHKIYIVHLVK
jgi:hypothetical protein